MKQLARGIASLGRGEDTQLVHMTPGEVRGLQQLAMAQGGSLTINPKTGLAEAGILSSMLPMLIGGALTVVSGGALSPLEAAIITGSGFGLAKGSLKEGLMAGLGAYGGAGLAGSLGEAGATSLANTAQTEGLKEAGITQIGGAGAGETPFANQAYTDYAANNTAPMTQAEFTKTPDFLAQQNAKIAAVANANPVTPYGDMTVGQGANAIGRGFQQVNPLSDSFDKNTAMDFLDKNKLQLAGALAGPALEAQKPQAPMAPAQPQPDQYDLELAKYHLNPDYTAYVPPQPNPYYHAVYAAKGGDVSHMAAGGNLYAGPLPQNPVIPSVGIDKDTDVDTANKDAYTAAIMRLKKQASGANLTPYTPEQTSIKGLGDIGPPTSMLANGGIAELPSEYAAGGKLLQGPGDGMSDSIPAVIQGAKPQRAALAQGEFVVPADVVSHLGNGSTDAGAKRLYAMMDKIRHARTGTKKQGKQINAASFMPT